MEAGNIIINEELIRRLKNSDLSAFDQIYKKYSHKLFIFTFSILKNEAEAEEIVQDVFVKIWESRSKIESNDSLSSYLFTIAYNHSISLIRKRINNKKYLEYLKYASEIQASPSGISEFEFRELRSMTEQLIENLPDRQKQVYKLHRYEGLTYPEIAERLTISKNTVENHMAKALKYLRNNLGKEFLIGLLFFYLFIQK